MTIALVLLGSVVAAGIGLFVAAINDFNRATIETWEAGE